jgi:endonuclease YncB( thermonuclease family)
MQSMARPSRAKPPPPLRSVERDRHGRLVAKVFSPNGVDISRRLVSAGWALAYRQYSTDYVDAEDEARTAKCGMWRGSFVKPRVWRASAAPHSYSEPPRRAVDSDANVMTRSV